MIKPHKIIWRREDGGWTAYYDVQGSHIRLVHYTKGLGKWWSLSQDRKYRDTCDPYFMKHCESQWSLDVVKEKVAKVLTEWFAELEKLRTWLAVLE